MFYLGIDIGKYSHSLCLLDGDDGSKQIWQVDNSKSGFIKLSDKLIKIFKSNFNDNLIVGMEATGHYFLNIYELFLSIGIDKKSIALLNPLQVKSFRNTNLRGSKTDNVDAEQIAILLHFGNYQRCNVTTDKMMNLRELTRLRSNIVANVGDLKRKIIAVLDRIFPEFADVFTDVFGKTAIALMSGYSTPDELAELSLDDLKSIVKKISKRGIASDKIERLHNSSKNSIGISFGKEAFKFELNILLDRLNFLKKQTNELEERIKEIVNEFNSKIFTIPGIGENTGATVLSEIGDINHFNSATKLIAFAGLDPKMRESGNYQGKTPISKRGSKYLRTSIWRSAMVACRVNEDFKEKYQERRDKGKSHRYAVTAAANKLTKIIYHILKNDCSFDNKQAYPKPENSEKITEK